MLKPLISFDIDIHYSTKLSENAYFLPNVYTDRVVFIN